MARFLRPFVLPGFLLLFLAGLYLFTMPQGLTWANDGADGGDLISAVYTGGIPHPTGYPTYLLFAGGFLKIPLGSIAFRANLFSAVCMLLAVYCLYRVVLKFSRQVDVSLLAGLLFGAFPLVWSQAIMAEVYGLQMLLSAASIYFLLQGWKSGWVQVASGLLLGLGIGNHLTAVLLLPFLFFVDRQDGAAQSPDTELRSKPVVLVLRLIGLAAGLGVYLILPIRAQNQAPVNWGNPQDWDGFWWLISGSMYHYRLEQFSWNYLWIGLKEWSRMLLVQLTIPGLAIGVLYFFTRAKVDRLHLMTAWLVAAYSCFSIYYYSPDSYVYLLLPLFAFAIWIGLGIDFGLRRLAPGRLKLRSSIVIGLLILIAGRAVWMIPEMNLSDNHQAERYSQAILDAAPEDALILTTGDEALFSLWYDHYVLGKRADLAVISMELATYPWYRASLAETYPALNLPEWFSARNLIQVNPGRPVCIPAQNLEPRLECKTD